MILLCLVLLFEPVAKCRAERHHDTKSTPNNVPESNWYEILSEHLGNRDVCTTKHS